MTSVIGPGATIGVLGSGQLGRMFALAARRMGYRVHTLSPSDDTPTGQVADVEWNANYDDLDAIRRFASLVDVVTFEFENVSVRAAEAAAEIVPVRPSGQVLHITQHRLREKTFLQSKGYPVPTFFRVTSEEECRQALAALGGKGVLKSAGWGYDGKGQSRIDSPNQLASAWQALQTSEAILERLIDLQCEISVIAARNPRGEVVDFGVIQNDHVAHILDTSFAPAAVSPAICQHAREIARQLMHDLDVVGVLCAELFVQQDDSILVNELAPRPHNSGHLTIDACITSQFEQQLRAICNFPLGSTEIVSPAAMANLLGDLWQQGEPCWESACQIPNIKLHLYGKHSALPRRKMGHLTALDKNAASARRLVLQARDALAPKSNSAHSLMI